jgi:hypothetical protein
MSKPPSMMLVRSSESEIANIRPRIRSIGSNSPKRVGTMPASNQAANTRISRMERLVSSIQILRMKSKLIRPSIQRPCYAVPFPENRISADMLFQSLFYSALMP